MMSQFVGLFFMVSRRELFELRILGDFRFVFDHVYISGGLH